MKYVVAVLLAGAAFVLHVTCAAFVQHGWSPQPLVILTVLAVWLGSSWYVRTSLIPAAVVLDVLQASTIPFVTLSVLVAWGIASLVQQRLLTNHSVASLLGISPLTLFATLAAGAGWLRIQQSLAPSTLPAGFSWSWGSTAITFVIEWFCAVLVGAFALILLRSLRRSFLYATR